MSDEDRTIPDEAWKHLSSATFSNGHLVPDTAFGYKPGDDPETEHWLSYFSLANWREWAGATVLCPRAPSYSGLLVRFDDADLFVRYGYRNPFREPGVPDWYFFWTKDHPMGVLKQWCRNHGLLPARDLPKGEGGYGISTGLRGEGRARRQDLPLGLQGYVTGFDIPDKWWQSTETIQSNRQRSARRAAIRRYAKEVWTTAKIDGRAWKVKRFVAIIGVACPRMDGVTPAFAAETVKPIIDAGTDSLLWDDDDAKHRHSTIYFQLPEPSDDGLHHLTVYIIPIPSGYHAAKGIATSSTRKWDANDERPDDAGGYTVTFAVPRELWITSNINDTKLLAEQKSDDRGRALAIRRDISGKLKELARLTWLDQGFVRTQRFVAVAGIQYPSRSRSDPDNAAETVSQILKAGAEAGAWPDTSSRHCHAVAFYKMPGRCAGDYHIIQLLVFPIAPAFHIASAIAETATREWTGTHDTTAEERK